MANCNVVMSRECFGRVQAYKTKLSQVFTEGTPGGFLLEEINRQNLTPTKIAEMSHEAFINLLLATKQPTILPELNNPLNGEDWNAEEWTLLSGLVPFFNDISIYNNGGRGAGRVHYDTPVTANFMYINGPLLVNNPVLWGDKSVLPTRPDLSQIIEYNAVNLEKLYAFYEKTLLAIFHLQNDISKLNKQKGFLRFPCIGGGAFGGDYGTEMRSGLAYVLTRFIEQHGNKFPHIGAVYYAPYQDRQSAFDCVNKTMEINGVELLVRPSHDNGEKNPLYTESLATLDEIHQKEKEYPVLSGRTNIVDIKNYSTEYKLTYFGAGDPVGYPGNDYWQGSSATIDGMLGASTSVCAAIANNPNYKGAYDSAKGKFLVANNNQQPWNVALNDQPLTANMIFIEEDGLSLLKGNELRKNIMQNSHFVDPARIEAALGPDWQDNPFIKIHNTLCDKRVMQGSRKKQVAHCKELLNHCYNLGNKSFTTTIKCLLYTLPRGTELSSFQKALGLAPSKNPYEQAFDTLVGIEDEKRYQEMFEQYLTYRECAVFNDIIIQKTGVDFPERQQKFLEKTKPDHYELGRTLSSGSSHSASCASSSSSYKPPTL